MSQKEQTKLVFDESVLLFAGDDFFSRGDQPAQD